MANTMQSSNNNNNKSGFGQSSLQRTPWTEAAAVPLQAMREEHLSASHMLELVSSPECQAKMACKLPLGEKPPLSLST